MPSLGRWLGDIIIIFFVDNFFTIFIENAVKIKSCTLYTILIIINQINRGVQNVCFKLYVENEILTNCISNFKCLNA